MGRILSSRLGCALLLLLLASPAGATTWTVNDVASLKQANVGAVAGDVINVAYLPGGYSWRPYPANSGSSTQQITYHGDLANTADPATAVIFNAGYGPGDSTNTKNYITWEGFYFRGGEIGFNSDSAVSVERPRGLKYINCTSEGGGTIKFVRDCLIQNCVIGRNSSDRTLIVRGFTDSVRIKQCSMRLFQNTGGSDAIRVDTQFDVNEFTMDTLATTGRVWERNLEIDSCTINIALTGTSCIVSNGDENPQGIKFRHWRGGSFSYNTVNVYDSTTGACVGKNKIPIWQRDSINGVNWLFTTFTCYPGTGGGSWRFDFTADGNDNAVAADPKNMRYQDCTFKNLGTTPYEGFNMRAGLNSTTIIRCSFVCGSGVNGPACFNIPTFDGTSSMTYNNFVSRSSQGRPALMITCPTTAGRALTFTNNIIYNDPAPVATTSAPMVIVSKPATYIANWNCYRNPGQLNEAVVYQGVARSVGPSGYMCGTPNPPLECNSIARPPGLTDSAATTYNKSLLSTSACRIAGENGTDIGVDQPSTDVTAPSAITNLVAYQIPPDSSFALYFTAPGDDAGTGSSVTSYVVKADTVEINDNTTFSAALTIPTTEIIVAPGALQGFRVDSSVLTAYTAIITVKPWWFAVKAYDEAGNASSISNLCNSVAARPIVRNGSGDTDNIEAEP